MMVLFLLFALLVAPAAHAGDLTAHPGRTEVRIRSEAFPLLPGRTVQAYGLPERLERLGYARVHERPTEPGTWFWGTEVVWIFRRAHRVEGRHWDAELLGLSLGPDGRITGGMDADGNSLRLNDRRGRWLEPELLAESTNGDRAVRLPVVLEELPERVWRPVLALEDHRFFDHVGVDGKAIARAALGNLKAGGVTQGGSTITQQLVKNRDLKPRRALDRKASEAVRALALEAEHTKQDILEAYLNTIYYGHVDGVAVHGLGTAARVYFSTDARDLSLAQAAALAATIQAPNRLSPLRHPEANRTRRDHALDRLQELGWAEAAAVAAAKATPVRADPSPPPERGADHFRAYVIDRVDEETGRRLERGLGFAADTTLDPLLQAHAEAVVGEHLATLRRRTGHGRDLQAALVALDAETGAILAHVGGDPAEGGDFDRASRARRQAGSTLKPLVLLEAFDACGLRDPLYTSALVSDGPVELNNWDGPWTPRNHDGRHHGDMSLRTALTHSWNLPHVRVAQYCGLDQVARRVERAGLVVPDPVPLSLSLGAIDTTPLALAGAYATFAPKLGKAAEPWGVLRIEKPGGGRLDKGRRDLDRASRRTSAWLVRDLLRDVVTDGTGHRAAVDGLGVAGKTGTTPKDAWFAGLADRLVVVVWIGRDGGGDLGLGGGSAAAPVFRDFVAEATQWRPPLPVDRPGGIVERKVNPATGRLVATPLHDGEAEVFRLGAIPPRDPLLAPDHDPPVIR